VWSRWLNGSAAKLGDLVRREGEAFEADAIVPVPLHRYRERERGYNQAALAKPLAKAAKLSPKPILLVRTRERPARQGTLHRGALGGRPCRLCHTFRQPS